MKASLLAFAATLTLLVGCGDSGSDPAEPTTGGSATPATAIDIKDFKYDPDPSTVKVGAKVSVTNSDGAPHTVTDKGAGKAFDSGTIEGGKDGTVTFSKAGSYAYFCEFHPTMAGRVTVEE